MAKGRGFSFGDASSDKVILYAGLGLLAWFVLSAGKGINNLFQGTGDLLGAAGNVGSTLANTANGALNSISNIGNDMLNTLSTPPPADANPWIPRIGLQMGGTTIGTPGTFPAQLAPAASDVGPITSMDPIG
jgi:hypothetical protein